MSDRPETSPLPEDRPSNEPQGSLPLAAGSAEVLYCLFTWGPLMAILWVLADTIKEPWAYTVRGVCLMLFPMQCAFWLGRKSILSLNIRHEPRPTE